MSQPSPRPSRLARWAVAALAAVAAIAPMSAASAETTTEETQLVVVAAGKTDAETRAPGTMYSGDELQLTLSFDNQRANEVPTAVAVVEIGDALLDPAMVAAWHARVTPATGLRSLATAPTPALTTANTTQWDLTVPVANTSALAAGTYPVRVTLQASNGATLGIARTTLTVGATPTTQQPQALVVVPVVAPSLSSGILTPGELTELTATTGTLTAVVDAVSGTAASVALAIDPAIGAAITLRGGSVQTAASWLKQLDDTRFERFALQFADADIAAQASAGFAAPIMPESLAGFVAGVGSGAEDAPNDAAFFNTRALLTVPNATPGVFWPRADASAEELATLAGFASNAVSLVASDSLAEPVTSPSAIIADVAQALILDSELSRVATLAATASNDVVRANALAQLAAMLTTAGAEAPVVFALDRAVFEAGAYTAGAALSPEGTAAHNQTRTPSTADLEALLATVSLNSRSTTLAELTAGPQTPVDVTPESNQARTFAAKTVFAQESAIAALASAITLPELLTGTEQARALQVLATSRFSTDDALAEALAAQAIHVEEILGAVSLDAPSSVQQISRSIELPITVRNNLPYAVTVHVITLPEDIKLDVDRDVQAIAMPHTHSVVKIPIESRVTSAKTSITLQLRTPSGSALGSEVKVPVSVHAQWESVGLTVMGALIGGLLIIGIVRTIRKRSGSATDESADASPNEPTEAP